MTLASRVMGRLMRLGPAWSPYVEVERDIPISMPDGVVLLADLYRPLGPIRVPAVLVRTPYGRSGLFGPVTPRLFAERGLAVLVQSVRGTGGSQGRFDPFVNERADGLATVAWMKRQPWFSGAFALDGASYLALAHWAIAAGAGPELKAICAQVSASGMRDGLYVGDSFALDVALRWTAFMADVEAPHALYHQMIATPRRLTRLWGHMPLNELDRLAVGATVAFFQEWLRHTEPGDSYWDDRDFSAGLGSVTAPVTLVGGWYDIFLPWLLRDYRALRQAGHRPRLTIGPWWHAQPALTAASCRESLAWLHAHLLGDPGGVRPSPVRLFVTGASVWRDFPDWPPPGVEVIRWHLHPHHLLSPVPAPPCDPDRYRYNPADPTPALAGPLLFGRATSVKPRKLAARPDILSFTSAALDRPVDIVGPVCAELYVRSSVDHTDFHVALDDLDPGGKSLHVCGGLQRVRPGRPAAADDGCLRVPVELWPAAHHFRAGHRIRVRVSSGAHPSFARNTGTAEPLGAACSLRSADQTVHHDPDHPSAILLPVLP